MKKSYTEFHNDCEVKKLMIKVMQNWKEKSDYYWDSYKNLLHQILQIDEHQTLSIKDLKKLMQEMKKEELVYYTTCIDTDNFKICGSGWFLTNKGEDL